MTAPRSGPFQGRRAAGLVFGLFVVGGLLLVFAGTLTRSTDIEAQAEKARAEVAALEARVAQGNAEIAFFESDAFVQQEEYLEGLVILTTFSKLKDLSDHLIELKSTLAIAPISEIASNKELKTAFLLIENLRNILVTAQ